MTPYGAYEKSMFQQNRELFSIIKKLKLEIEVLKINLAVADKNTQTKGY